MFGKGKRGLQTELFYVDLKPMTAKKKNIVVSAEKKQPVVVVLGHVDHGKSSLLEAIRDFKITEKESGGITQHIGAYEVNHNGKKITFIDTPGHEAFSAMRSRGASVADIALLVIDAAQSVQPQTKEAIMAIEKAGIPMIVVLSKIDVPTADPEKIKRDLAKINIFVESIGGKTLSVEVSAKEKRGINDLLEIIVLIADMQNFSADINCPAQGTIIESHMDSQKGAVATAIIEKGVLRKKDIVATETASGKIRFLENFLQKQVGNAAPGQAVVIFGFEKIPAIGEKFLVYLNAELAEERTVFPKKEVKIIKEELSEKEGQKTVGIILKGDYFGSLEAIREMLKNLPQERIVLKILKSEVGDITESDVRLAETTNGQIIGFRVKISQAALQLIKKDDRKKVRVKTFEIIYELIQNIRDGMEKSLEPEISRKETGKIKAMIIFFAEKNRQIVGGKITEGEIKKGDKLEVFRGDKKIGSGKIINLQRDKKDAEKLSKGNDCGILFEGNVKIEKGDILVAFIEERRRGEL